MLAGLKARGAQSVFVRYLLGLPGHPTTDGVLAAITTTLAWGPLMRKRVSRLTAESLPWWMRLFGALVGASVPADQHAAEAFCGIATRDILERRPITEVAFIALLGLPPNPADLFSFQVLIGLLLTNGPGTISAQGAKGAVSADGPENPSRVQLNKAVVGFLTHTGYAHGGNGYEGIAFLIDQFKDTGLDDPGNRDHGLDLRAIAQRYVKAYAGYKSSQKNTGSLEIQKIPGINHPVFKDKPVNHDPREVFIANLFARARRVQRLPRVLSHAGAGAVRGRGLAQCLLREHRCGHRCVAAEDALEALPQRPIQCGGARDRRIHDLPLSAHARLRRRDR